MKRISSNMTFFYKRLMPLILLGMIAFFLYPLISLMIINVKAGNSIFSLYVNPIYLIFIGLPLFFLIAYRIFFSAIADQVFDLGQSLLIKQSNQDITLPLTDIQTISYSYTPFFKTAFVTILTKQDTALGNTIKFIPPFTWIPFRKHKAINDLFQKVRAINK